MKKAGYIFITVLQIGLLAGAYIVNYFTKTKMGMARYVMYKNRNWEQEYPLALLRNILVVVLIILVLAVITATIRYKHKLGKLQMGMCAVMVVLAVFSFTFVLSNTSQTLRAYYFMSPMVCAALLLQVLKTGIAIGTGSRSYRAEKRE